MKSFYKGGSELPTGKGSSCSKQIESKKYRAKSPKLLPFFRLYFTSIAPVLMKYLLSTDIVLFMQLLRKQIEKGRIYYKSTCRILGNYWIGQGILVAVKCFKKKAEKEAYSSGLRVLFGKPLTQRRIKVDSPSGVLRLLFDFSSRTSRSTLEALSKPSRRIVGPIPNDSRRDLEALRKGSRTEVDQKLINGRGRFGVNTCLKRVWDFLIKASQESNTVYSQAVASSQLIMLESTVGSSLSYLKYTAKILSKYLKNTRELLNKYLIAAKELLYVSRFLVKISSVIEFYAKVGSIEFVGRVNGLCLKFKGFPAFYKCRVCEEGDFIIQQESGAQDALKYFVSMCGYKRHFRLWLICLVLVFHMFSLSAQTPRKESGAGGLSSIKALTIGDTIPESIWQLKMPVHNDRKGRSTISLNDFKDNKLIILDFWATWCSNCLESFPKLDLLKDTFKDDFGVLLINCKQTGDNKEKIDRVFKKYKDNYQFNVQFPYLMADTIFNALFPHRGVPHVVWVGNDRVVKAITYTAELQADNVRRILAGQKASFYRKEDDKYKLEDSLSTDTLKLFSSYLSKRREGIREMGVQIKEKGNEKEFTFLNSSVAMRIYEHLRDGGHPIERNLWLFDNSLEKEVRRKFKTPQRYIDEYCYFLQYPKDRTDFDPYWKMIHDIQDGFGIKWEVRKGILEVWKIESSPEVIRYRTKGKIPLVSLGINDNKKFIQNIPLRNSFNVLSWFLNKPVLLGNIADINIDFELPTDLLGYTDEQLRELLERLGAKITVEPQEVAYVYFSKDRGI